ANTPHTSALAAITHPPNLKGRRSISPHQHLILPLPSFLLESHTHTSTAPTAADHPPLLPPFKINSPHLCQQSYKPNTQPTNKPLSQSSS
ncbi:hypothetical protein GQ607_011526, partial [Colletotrichum asianum]